MPFFKESFLNYQVNGTFEPQPLQLQASVNDQVESRSKRLLISQFLYRKQKIRHRIFEHPFIFDSSNPAGIGKASLCNKLQKFVVVKEYLVDGIELEQ